MRKTFSVLTVFVFVLSLYGCGGSGGGSSPGTHTPSISSLYYYPTSASQNEGGGAVTVDFHFDFIDNGGDISSLTLNVYDSYAVLLDTVTVPINGHSGDTSGTLYWTTSADTSVKGSYLVEIYITDSNSHTSNKLYGTFNVV